MKIEDYYAAQVGWSRSTFGEGRRTKGIVEHIGKELREVLSDPDDLSEWVDLIILAMDGYWRHGGSPETLMADLMVKQAKNFSRKWPAPTSEDHAVEHDRTGDDPR